MRQKPNERYSQTGLSERHSDHPAQHVVLRRLNLNSKLVLDRHEIGFDGGDIGFEFGLDRCDVAFEFNPDRCDVAFEFSLDRCDVA